MNETDRTWAEIHLDRIAHNYTLIRRQLPQGCRFLAPVKADAYGHGAVAVSRLMCDLGCDYLAVACLPEALALREAGIPLPILVYGHTDPEDAPLMAREGITQAVFTLEAARAYSYTLEGTGTRLTVHIKLDTGMGRLGFPCRGDDLSGPLEVMGLPCLDVEGVFTHFPVADMDEDDYTLGQTDYFVRAVDELEARSGLEIPLRHAANSGGALRLPETHLNMVRPGISLYGLSPNPDFVHAELRPAMELKTRIVQVRSFDGGESISYGRTYQTRDGQVLAVVPVGYADGLHRVLSGKMQMLLAGQRISQVGRICMDMCMVDVSPIKKVSVGDVVTVFGRDGDEEITVDEHSSLAGTISYELLCAVSPRVPRLYLS